MPAKQNFGRCTSSRLSAGSLVTREIEERIHKQAANKTHYAAKRNLHFNS